MSYSAVFIDSVHGSCEKILIANGFACIRGFDMSDMELFKAMENAEVWIIRSRFKLTKEIIEKGRRLRCIARAGAGMENIDVNFAQRRGVQCVHAPEGNKDAVAEHAMGMLLMLMNNLARADREVRGGLWRREENRGIEIKGKTIGIIGYGNMGSAFAERLSGFGVKVLAYDKYKRDFANTYVKEVSMQEIFNHADVVSLHIPLTDETKYLVNTEWLHQFKKNIVLINTARGKCVLTKDLVKAMRLGKVVGACLDVLEYEAVSFEKMESEKIPEDLEYIFRSDRVVLSPHIAGWTHESNEKIAEILASRILNVISDI